MSTNAISKLVPWFCVALLAFGCDDGDEATAGDGGANGDADGDVDGDGDVDTDSDNGPDYDIHPMVGNIAVHADGTFTITSAFEYEFGAVFGEGESAVTLCVGPGYYNQCAGWFEPDGELLFAREIGPGASAGVQALPDAGTLFVVGEGDTLLAAFDEAGSPSWSAFAEGPRTVELLRDSAGASFAFGSIGTDLSLGDEPVLDAGVDAGPYDGPTTAVAADGETGSQAFLARYGPDGSLTWARTASGWSALSGVVPLGDGSLIVAGYYRQSMTLNAGLDDAVTLDDPMEPGEGSAFFAHYSAAGNLQWAIDPHFCLYGPSVAPLPDGSFIAVCRGQALTRFDSSSGEIIWSDPASADENHGFNGVTTTDDSAILLTDRFSGERTYETAAGAVTVDFGEAHGSALLRYEDDGSLVWARKLAEYGHYVLSHRLVVLDDGSILLAGMVVESITLGDGPDAVTLEAHSSFTYPVGDVYLAKLSPVGDLLWARIIVRTAE